MFYDILPVFFFVGQTESARIHGRKFSRKKYLSICETCQNISQVKIILKKLINHMLEQTWEVLLLDMSTTMQESIADKLPE